MTIKTKKIKEIRRLIRKAIRWHRIDDGMPTFWSNENYKYAKRHKELTLQQSEKNYIYYTRSSRAIEDIANKIYGVCRK